MKKNSSFTLIEMLVVLMIIAIILPATFMILYNIMQQQVKLYKLTETKRQGDYILSFIKETILTDIKGMQDSPGLVANPVCTGAGTTGGSHNGPDIYFIHKRSVPGTPPETIQFRLVSGALEYVDTLGTVSNLNSTQVRVEREGAFGFIECFKKNDEVLPLITIRYRVTYVDAEPLARQTSLFYSTRIRLRNQ